MRPRGLPLLLVLLVPLTLAATAWAGKAFVQKDREVIDEATWIFVGEITSQERSSDACTSDIEMKVRSLELLKGSPREFEAIYYGVRTYHFAEGCPSKHVMTAPQSSTLDPGTKLIATVGGKRYARDDAVWATFDLSRRGEIEGWLKQQQPPASPKEGQSP